MRSVVYILLATILIGCATKPPKIDELDLLMRNAIREDIENMNPLLFKAIEETYAEAISLCKSEDKENLKRCKEKRDTLKDMVDTAIYIKEKMKSLNLK